MKKYYVIALAGVIVGLCGLLSSHVALCFLLAGTASRCAL